MESSPLLDPSVLFFILGLFAGLVRSNLEVPIAIARFLSLYLLMALGLKGGFSLAESGFNRLIGSQKRVSKLYFWKVSKFSTFKNSQKNLQKNGGSFSYVSRDQHQSLQVNTHFSAFFEIYKIVTPSHPSKLKISTKFHQTFSHFCKIFCKNHYFSTIFIDFRADSDQIFSEFRSSF